MNAERIKQYLLENKWRAALLGVLAVLVLLFLYSLLSASLNTARSKGGMLGILNSAGPSAPLVSSRQVASDYSYAEIGGNSLIFPPTNQGGASYVDVKDRKVVRIGALSIIVKQAEPTFETISRLATEAGGFVEVKQANTYQGGGGQVYGSISVRIPSDKFDEIIKKVKELAVRVTSENISADDVTRQYVDLEAQLKNLKAEEEQYLSLMKRTGTVTEILQVSQQLANVRGRVERMQAELVYLSGQISMSKLTVSITAEAEAKILGIVWSPLSDIKRAINGAVSDLVNYLKWLIDFIFALPILILKAATWVLIIWIAWKMIKIIKRRFFDSHPHIDQ